MRDDILGDDVGIRSGGGGGEGTRISRGGTQLKSFMQMSICFKIAFSVSNVRVMHTDPFIRKLFFEDLGARW